jgi:hypothetical protein
MFATVFARFGGPRVRIPRELWHKLRRCAALAGYATPEELVIHVLEKELARLEPDDSDEDIQRKLRGLGYIR